MPVMKGILRYHDDASGLDWTITNYQTGALPIDMFLPANNWNTAYLACCSDTVRILDMRISDTTLYRDIIVIPPGAFAQDNGAIAGESTEIASYAQWRGNGSAVNQGSNAWKLHGISESKVDASNLDQADAAIVALEAACLVYFKQYRPNAGSRLPAIVGAADFQTGVISGMYFKRLGRPFGLPGQSR